MNYRDAKFSAWEILLRKVKLGGQYMGYLVNLATKVGAHVKQGTLAKVVLKNLGIIRVYETAKPDVYRGEKAKNYLAERQYDKIWQTEQDIMRDMISRIPRDISALDVPFGTGRFVDIFLERNIEIYGLDISKDMIDAAKDTLGDDFQYCHVIIGNADSIPYENTSFDLVVSFRFFGLISIEMSKKVLAEIDRVTKNFAIIRVPVRKDSAPPVRNIKPTESVMGKLYENDIVNMFNTNNFFVSEKAIIYEEKNVLYCVYLLRKNDVNIS